VCSAFFVWRTLLLHTVLRDCVCVPYTVPTVQTVASAALTTVDGHTHALTAVVLQAVYDETLEQLHSTCALCIIHIYVSLGNGDAAVPSQLCQHTHAHTFVGKLGDEGATWGV
jgi:hypothetical protein